MTPIEYRIWISDGSEINEHGSHAVVVVAKYEDGEMDSQWLLGRTVDIDVDENGTPVDRPEDVLAGDIRTAKDAAEAASGPLAWVYHAEDGGYWDGKV